MIEVVFAVKIADGETSAATLMVDGSVYELLSPSTSMIVSRTVRVPAAVYWCTGFSTVAFAVPSPKLHWYVDGAFPLPPVCVKLTD